MAFPVSYGESGGGYPPPPAPGGGYGAPPAPAASNPGYGAPGAGQPPPQPWQGGQERTMLQPQGALGLNPAFATAALAAPAPSAPPAAPPPPAAPVAPNQDPALAETAAGRPIDPAVVQRRGSPNRLAPILVGVVAVLLIGSAAVAMIVMGKRKGGGDASAAASGSASASAAPAADTASAAPSASATPSATPVAAPTETAAPTPTESASASAGPAPIESTLTCVPDCDEIRLDDKPLDLTKPIVIEPGKHTLSATKSGYYPIKETLVVKQGQKVERMFTLKEKPTAPVSTGGPGPGPGPTTTGPLKPCGKFLKRAGCK